jgi:anti-sigma factor RsiW
VAEGSSPRNCGELFDFVSQYLDAEASPEICREIEKHLADCPSCIAFVQSLRRSVDLCHGYQAGEAPAPLPADAKEQLRAIYLKALSKA